MKQQEVYKKIGAILKELNEQYDYLGKANEQLNDLELELFVANAHFLADHAEVLRKLNQHFEVPATIKDEPAAKPDEKFFEPVVQQIINEPYHSPLPGETAIVFEFTPSQTPETENSAIDSEPILETPEEPEIIKHELVIDESELWEDEEDTGFDIDEVSEPALIREKPIERNIEPIIEKETLPIAEPKVSAVADTRKPELQTADHSNTETSEPLTINQMMAAQLQKAGSLSEQLHAQSISDLKQAIRLNDKLLFIKDLFNGYNLAYSEAIDLLNRFHSFEEAEEFLRINYSVKNQWDSKQATVDKFHALLKRRFA